MQIHPFKLDRLFVAITILLLAGLLGMGCAEMFLLRPLRQSIDRGMVSHEFATTVAHK
jgi:hypothetical protein